MGCKVHAPDPAHHLQTQDDRKAQGLVKDEFQQVMKWLIVPLIQKDVEQRVKDNCPTFGGQSMQDIKAEWQGKFWGAYQCLRENKWECSGTPAVKQAEKRAVKAAEQADQKEASAREACARAAAALDEAKKCKEEMPEMSQGSEQIQQHPQAQQQQHRVQESAQAFWRAFAKAELACAAAVEARRNAAECREAADTAAKYIEYRPSSTPHVISYDNCPSYSLYEGSSKTKILPILSLLQVHLHIAQMHGVLLSSRMQADSGVLNNGWLCSS